MKKSTIKKPIVFAMDVKKRENKNFFCRFFVIYFFFSGPDNISNNVLHTFSKIKMKNRKKIKITGKN